MGMFHHNHPPTPLTPGGWVGNVHVMETTTPARQLADHKIPGGLDAYVRTWRSEGMSWRSIANCLAIQHNVTLSHEILRRWYKDTPA